MSLRLPKVILHDMVEAVEKGLALQKEWIFHSLLRMPKPAMRSIII